MVEAGSNRTAAGFRQLSSRVDEATKEALEAMLTRQQADQMRELLRADPNVSVNYDYTTGRSGYIVLRASREGDFDAELIAQIKRIALGAIRLSYSRGDTAIRTTLSAKVTHASKERLRVP